MNLAALKKIIDSWWSEACQKVKEAAVFLDDRAAECLHWHGGLLRLLDAGAASVKMLSSFEKGDMNDRKAVFITTGSLMGETVRKMEDIIKASHFMYCIVITTIPAGIHHPTKYESEEKQVFSVVENMLLEWMGSRNYSSEVVYIPIFAACVLPGIFIMPPFSEMFSPLKILSEDFLLAKKGSESGIRSLPVTMQTNVKMLVHSVNSLLEGLQVKGDIFSLGFLSHIVGVELENLIQARSKRKVTAGKASVLVIDRSLDLAGPLSQTVDTLFDKILRVLPHLPGHTCDVSVNMSDLTASSSNTVFGRPLLAPGCIAHKNNPVEVAVLTSLFTSRQKEAVMEINRRLVEVASKEGISVDMGSRLTPDMLKRRILAFRNKPSSIMKYNGLLQQALAAVQTLEHSDNNYIENVLGTEKLLMQNLSVSEDSVTNNIVDLIAQRKQRNYKLEDILTIIAFLYVLSGNDILKKESCESAVQTAIVEALFQDIVEAPDFVKTFVGDVLDDQNILTSVETFLWTLKKLGNMRKDLKKHKSVFQAGDPALPAVYIPLLKQVVDDIFNSSITEIPDVEFHSAGFRDMIKTGFSLFMNVSKPHPRDNPLLILIVLGGITATEIKLVRENAARHGNTEVIVGSTSLVTPRLIMEEVASIIQNKESSEI